MNLMKQKNNKLMIERERTNLSNERTMLSYLRTCFSLIFAGLGILRFLEGNKVNAAIAYLLIIFGLLIGYSGMILFHRRRIKYKKICF